MRFDALVIGAGPAGATAALTLARAGLAVAVVEKAAFPRRKVCGEYISATTWPALRALGVAGELVAAAGPPVDRVGLFAGDDVLDSPMPAPREGDPWGRAVGRELLDTLLLERAQRAGAQLWQPWSVVDCRATTGGHVATLGSRGWGREELQARLVVAAHGSWERTPWVDRPPPASDLLAFKARFEGARLAGGLMPLILFPGGYGGMVASDGARVSLSCCIRRAALRRCRERRPGLSAGEALLAHIVDSCRGVREALAPARQDGPWLAAGPIRPGVHVRAQRGVFAAGNAAGEAHPLVAEGISMAIQAGCMLGGEVAAQGSLDDRALDAIGARYAARWARMFAWRVRASSLFAALTVPGAVAPASIALLRRMPAVLTWGARRSGKARAPALQASP